MSDYTTDITVTDFITHFRSSTVATVTTCSGPDCGISVITVSEATSMTITGEVVVPTTLSSAVEVSTTLKAPHASSILTTKVSSASSASHYSSASISSYDAGAGKAAVGVAGVVGIVAMLI
ncbi:hypothetical protein JCM33374_g3672 [Metschnikowia sp. JCM 33374]|nr:hypothetical protein JCM33374_g3672 [Metschnikowia sp. JCM 33374]